MNPVLSNSKVSLCFVGSVADYFGIWEQKMFSLVCVVLGGREKSWGGRGLWKDCREEVLSLESFSVILNFNYSDTISDYVCCGKILPLFIAGLLY